MIKYRFGFCLFCILFQGRVFGEAAVQKEAGVKNDIIITNQGEKVRYRLKTGQLAFYNEAGQRIPWPSKENDLWGQNAAFEDSALQYGDNGNGTITDLQTGLIWQKEQAENKMTWDEALDYAGKLQLAGFSDWRLPTVKELQSLVNYNVDSPTFEREYFPTSFISRKDMQFWTATRVANFQYVQDAYAIDFYHGYIQSFPQSLQHYVRCVRGGQYPEKHCFVVNKNGTLTDKASGLMWQIRDDGVVRSWVEALKYAKNLRLGGYSDWRLPNASELYSLVNTERADAALVGIIKLSDLKKSVWSSTSLTVAPEKAWCVAFSGENQKHPGWTGGAMLASLKDKLTAKKDERKPLSQFQRPSMNGGRGHGRGPGGPGGMRGGFGGMPEGGQMMPPPGGMKDGEAQNMLSRDSNRDLKEQIMPIEDENTNYQNLVLCVRNAGGSANK